MAFVREKHLRGLFLSPKSTAAVKSDQSSRGTAQPVSWHLRAKKRREGGNERGGRRKKREREHERVGRKKNPAASMPQPHAAFKGAGGSGGRGEGEVRRREERRGERLLAPSVHVFCIPALIFLQSNAGVLSVQMKREELPFWVPCSERRRCVFVY